jgi:membrane protein
MRKALNRIGHVQPKSGALGTFVRARLVAFALVLGFGFLLVASLLLSAALTAFTDYLSKAMPILARTLALLGFVLSTAVLTVAFAAFLRWLPDSPPRWGPVWVGAIVSAVMFSLGKELIGMYIGRVSVTNSFGAAGSVVVIMLWVYYSSQILLFGAAMTWALEGVRAEQPQPAAPARSTPEGKPPAASVKDEALVTDH